MGLLGNIFSGIGKIGKGIAKAIDNPLFRAAAPIAKFVPGYGQAFAAVTGISNAIAGNAAYESTIGATVGGQAGTIYAGGSPVFNERLPPMQIGTSLNIPGLLGNIFPSLPGAGGSFGGGGASGSYPVPVGAGVGVGLGAKRIGIGPNGQLCVMKKRRRMNPMNARAARRAIRRVRAVRKILTRIERQLPTRVVHSRKGK